MIATTVADRLKLRARCYAFRVAWVDQVDSDLAATRRLLAAAVAERDRLRRDLGRISDRAQWKADRLADRDADLRDANARALAGEVELEEIRAELRATGHTVTGDTARDVDAAIDRERSRAQDFVERLADVLGWDEHRACWPYSTPHLVREVAVRLGRPMPRRSLRYAGWPAGSRHARALACTCRGDRGWAPSSMVDPRCPEHSPGRRFGRPVAPAALPTARRRCGNTETPDAHHGPCHQPPAHTGWHQDRFGYQWASGPEGRRAYARAVGQCGADLDGQACSLTAGHLGPCAPPGGWHRVTFADGVVQSHEPQCTLPGPHASACEWVPF